MARRERTHHHLDILKVLGNAKPSLRKAILREADQSVVYALCELCDNLLIGNVNLTPAQRDKLARHKAALRHLAQRRVAWKKKKNFLVQKGGAFLPILLSVLASAIGGLLGGA